MSSIVVLTLVTAQVALESDTPLHFLYGDYYLFFSFYGDLFGVVGLVGVGMALYRRYFADFHRIRWDERLEDHPFRRMREAGLLATLNTDDPAMTDLDLGREYRSVAAALGMGWDEMTAVALDGVEASWLDDGEKRELCADFEREIAAIQPPA